VYRGKIVLDGLGKHYGTAWDDAIVGDTSRTVGRDDHDVIVWHCIDRVIIARTIAVIPMLDSDDIRFDSLVIS
jgi:hypothetical protein